MDLSVLIQLALVGVLLVFSAFFSSSETALFSLSSTQLEEMRKQRTPRYKIIARLLSEPRRLIVTILLGNEFTNLLLSSICASLIIATFGESKSYYNIFIATPLLLVFGEITPKALAVRNNKAFSKFQAPLVESFAVAITPIRIVVRIIADGVISLIVGSQRKTGNLISEDMVLTLANEAVGDGVLEHIEAHYIRQIFKFGDATVDDVMTPRSNMIFVPHSARPQDIISTIQTHKRDKLVIYREAHDKVVGLLFARDLLGLDLKRKRSDNWLVNMARKPMLVPETKSLLDLFLQMRAQQISVALVIDEYGGIIGQVSLNDVLEFIFGEVPQNTTNKKSNNKLTKKVKLPATMEVADFNRKYLASLPTEHSDTLNGLIIHYYGELPPRSMCLTIEGINFTVSSLEGNKIKEVYVEPTKRKIAKSSLLPRRKLSKDTEKKKATQKLPKAERSSTSTPATPQKKATNKPKPVATNTKTKSKAKAAPAKKPQKASKPTSPKKPAKRTTAKK